MAAIIPHHAQVVRLSSKVEDKTSLCESYEKQMQRVQEQLLRDIEDKDFKIDKLKSDLAKLEVITKWKLGGP